MKIKRNDNNNDNDNIDANDLKIWTEGGRRKHQQKNTIWVLENVANRSSTFVLHLCLFFNFIVIIYCFNWA